MEDGAVVHLCWPLREAWERVSQSGRQGGAAPTATARCDLAPRVIGCTPVGELILNLGELILNRGKFGVITCTKRSTRFVIISVT